ncbi:phage tail protein [Klebsiella pneumoniae]|nr:phage tail protein [Klebsiella pneumoniae]
MKHTEIRQAVIEGLESVIGNSTIFFDGRPAVIEEEDFPAVAVYLTDAEYTGEDLDADTWQATLHIEVFLPAQVPDSQLDEWMENRVYPAISGISALNGLITVMVQQGYEYQRDDSLGLWSSADMKYSITYDM